ncbi:ATP-dependent DNA helicase [Campylobacter canadensis]|uniref:AAA family ATPase n=1 Tax=Campylobacter canadensis TaxID=449520 RepID=A0ABS7WUR1_9BACT|nr:AAA family ATPase [Campylobacter canadensis]MBZ7987769.1 AAA family ATPase [Campylobacter canadensis]MBZ7998566.1 AAA family ATPase [Campylobacter canadensis]
MPKDQIINVSNNICKNINLEGDRGFISQNILSNLRTLLEHTFIVLYNIDNNDNLTDTYDNINKAIAYVSDKSKYQDFKKFHDFIQISLSHYLSNEDSSERLMLKYYEYLLKLRKLHKEYCKLDTLECLEKFPINMDTNSLKYYLAVAHSINGNDNSFGNYGIYYIHYKKPFFIEDEIYYEISLTIAHDYASKFDKIIAFTKLNIMDNYSVSLKIHNTEIDIFGNSIPIKIITDWKVNIRPCEIKNFCSIFMRQNYNFTRTNLHIQFMEHMQKENMNLLDIVLSEKYLEIKKQFAKDKFVFFFECLDKAREIIRSKSKGENCLRYILNTMHNNVIKKQLSLSVNQYLNNLYLDYGCIPFDAMPFCSSLKGHNPKFYDLYNCINVQHRKHELLVRKIRNNSDVNGNLYISKDELGHFFENDNINTLINKYHNKLYHKHREKRGVGVLYDKYFYMQEYEKNIKEIMQLFQDKSKDSNTKYQNAITKYLEENPHKVDCDEKRQFLSSVFLNSKLALIYGAAGTGKTMLIELFSNAFADFDKVFLTNTNSALYNLRKRVNVKNSRFSTIAKAKNKETSCDILVIDESSTVNNADMIQVLKNVNFDILICVGDIYQIESIGFGNWFLLAKKIFNGIELKQVYRSQDEKLQILWDNVRKLDESSLETAIKKGCSKNLSSFSFDKKYENSIILCLNYGGIYGVNNINTLLQENNKNKAYHFNGLIYKIGDPILFNDTKRFGDEIYNNLQGIIEDIKPIDDNNIEFAIKIYKIIENVDNIECDFVIHDDVSTTIGFKVERQNDDSDNDDEEKHVVPFHVAYAISIHKAQGLEYDNVILMVSDEIEEQITHNIFYTAITRAKKDLTIYWSPETEKKVLDNLKIRDIDRDYNLLKPSLKL